MGVVTASLTALLGYLIQFGRYNPKTTDDFKSTYDYIVVGAGSAGSVVASRLTEDPCVSVLLLEAGPNAGLLSEVPAVALFMQHAENDWYYKSIPQKHSALQAVNRQVVIPRGKGLGGTSLLNCLLYVRGNKRDYDQWADHGCTGWAWKDVFPYFLKLENNTNSDFVKTGYHATKGPYSVENLRYKSKTITAFANAGKELGYEHRDINGEKQTGFFKMQGTTRNGRRNSNSKAYLIPAENRTNLDIVKEALVTKILINDKKEAYGVKFEKDGKEYDVKAKKEVIVSGGAINSPQLLMLSGIGPKAHLEKLGIPVVSDLPVGDNYQDHPGTANLPFIVPGAENLKSLIANHNNTVDDFNRYGTGPLTSLSGVEGLAWVNSKGNDPAIDWPDIEIHFISLSPTSDKGIESKLILGISDHAYDQVYKPYEGKQAFLFFPVLLRPKSRGTIRLASTNPREYPLIDPNLLQFEEDIEKIVDGFQISVDIVTKTKAFKDLGAEMFTTKFPGCEQYEMNSTYYSRDYLRCIAKGYTLCIFHPSCTCRMGSLSDKTTVVDPQLRVKGVKNLRVVDSSVMPFVPSGNINTPTTMIGEKASDMIKKSNPDRKSCKA